MFAELMWRNCPKFLSSKIYANLLKNVLIVQQGPLAPFQILLWRWEMMMAEQVMFILTNLPAKAWAFAHLECDCITGICTWFCALWIGPVSCAKLDILSNYSKLSCNLYSTCRLELFGFFHCCKYDLQDILLALTLNLIIYQQPFRARIPRRTLIMLQV